MSQSQSLTAGWGCCSRGWPATTGSASALCCFLGGHDRGSSHQHDARASGQAGNDGNHSLARRASEGSVEDQIVYVALLADGSQRTDTPAEFVEKFGWKNDPEKAELLGK